LVNIVPRQETVLLLPSPLHATHHIHPQGHQLDMDYFVIYQSE
jgi:hypothetical protein